MLLSDSVGGAEDSRNGFAKRIPVNVTDRSTAMFPPRRAATRESERERIPERRDRGVAVDSGIQRYHRDVSDIVRLWINLIAGPKASPDLQALARNAARIEIKALYRNGSRLRRVRRRRY
jgi:hypothetical protein